MVEIENILFFYLVDTTFALLWIFIMLFLIVYVYNDAKERNMDPGVWIVLIVFFNVLAFIIYICTRKEKNILKKETVEKYKRGR